MPHISNASRLIEIANLSETAKIIMTDLGARTRHRSFSDIKRQKLELIAKDYKVVEADANMFWRLMEQEGFGSLLLSKKGKPERFNWNYNLKEIAAIALEEKVATRKINPVDPVGKVRSTVKAAAQAKPTFFEQSPRIVGQARELIAKSEGTKINAMSTKPFEGVPMFRAPASSILTGQSVAEKTVAVPIRNGEFDIEIKMPLDVTKAEIEMAVRVIMRRLA